jgi:S1-C subfamily serine protease
VVKWLLLSLSGLALLIQPASRPGDPEPAAPAAPRAVDLAGRRTVIIQPGGEQEVIVAVPSTREAPNAPSKLTPRAAADLLDGLGSTDPAQRERSMQGLLSLRRPDLPILHEAARSVAPVLPELLEPLRSAVSHIYLTGEPYDAIATMGFLGITLNPISIPVGEPPERRLGAGELPVQGIAVTNRLPGVAGYEFLQEGDVILAVDGRGMFRGTDDFATAVRGRQPGTVVTMRLLRGGRVIDVSIPLSPRPVGMDQINALDVLRNQRDNRASTYWETVWAPVVESTSTTRPAPPLQAPPRK